MSLHPAAGTAKLGQQGPDLRPILFLHIPKTAGTAFLLTLHNLFGEARVERVFTENKGVECIPALGLAPPAHLACINGHPPRHYWNDHLARFRPYTLLRAPVARVQSLFRYIRNESDATLDAWRLRRGFTFAEFIASRNLSVLEHSSNGMCRMLSGDRRFTTPTCFDDPMAFDDPANHPAILDAAMRLLEEIDFGVVEDMAASLRLVQARWGIPFAIEDVVANTTERVGIEHEPESIRAIAALNTLDIALYEHATLLFRQRLAALDVLREPENPRAVFAPEIGKPVLLSEIPGRQGFLDFEQTGTAWLDHTTTSRIHFRPQGPRGRLALRFYNGETAYPVERIVLRLDGRQVKTRVLVNRDNWSEIETELLDLVDAVHELTIIPPYCIAERVMHPTTRNRRKLSVALSSVELRAPDDPRSQGAPKAID